MFDVDQLGARFGFHVERSDGPMDATWDWPRFVATLRQKAHWSPIQTAMRRLGLMGEVYLSAPDGPVRKAGEVSADRKDLVWHADDNAAGEAVTWPQLADRLDAVEPEKWCGFVLCARLDKSQAIALGQHVADKAVEVYKALLPLYNASVGHSE